MEEMGRVRIAIIGTGQRARAFAMMVSRFNTIELTALCDIDAERLESFAAHREFFNAETEREFEPPKLYTDFDKLLGDDVCDAVIITVPDSAHREVAEKAFNAGKHCMLEKPMALTAEDCHAIIKAKEKSGCILQMGFVLRCTPFYRKIKEIVDSGKLGQIMSIDACEYLNVSHSVSYMRRWHRKKVNSGSFLLAKCSHDLDLLAWLANSHPVKVASFGGNNFFLPSKQPETHCSKCPDKKVCPYEFTRQSDNFIFIDDRAHKDPLKYNLDLCVYNDDKDIVDNQVVIIEFENKIRAQFSLQCFYPGDLSERMIRINGSAAYLEAKFTKNIIEVTKQEKKKEIIDLNEEVSMNDGHGGGDKPFLEEFIACIINKKEPVADLHAGLNSNLLAMAIDQAMLTGQVIQL